MQDRMPDITEIPGASALINTIQTAAKGRERLIVAIAGAPGSGKSTLADGLCAALNAGGEGAAVLPMDGYHLDNALLDARGWRPRKGAPHTFDVGGLARDLARLRVGDVPVLVPVFDRGLDLSRNAAREIDPATRIILAEGNYLLLDQAPWSGLAGYFDLTVFLSVPEPVLEARLIRRWIDNDHSPGAARARALGNDIPNARLVAAQTRAADVVLTGG